MQRIITFRRPCLVVHRLCLKHGRSEFGRSDLSFSFANQLPSEHTHAYILMVNALIKTKEGDHNKKKKKKEVELTMDQLDQVSGGAGIGRVYRCMNCNRSFRSYLAYEYNKRAEAEQQQQQQQQQQ